MDSSGQQTKYTAQVENQASEPSSSMEQELLDCMEHSNAPETASHEGNKPFAEVRPAIESAQALFDDPAIISPGGDRYHKDMVAKYPTNSNELDLDVVKWFVKAPKGPLVSHNLGCYQLSLDKLPVNIIEAGWTMGFNHIDNVGDKSIALVLGVSEEEAVNFCSFKFHAQSGALMLVSNNDEVSVEYFVEPSGFKSLEIGEMAVMYQAVNRIRLCQFWEYDLVFTAKPNDLPSIIAKRNEAIGCQSKCFPIVSPATNFSRLGNVVMTGNS